MYTRTQWVDNTTPIDKDNLNKIEQGIYDNSLVVEAVTNTLNPTDTETYKTAELTEGQITDVIGVSDILIKGQTSQDGTPTPSAPVDVNVVSGSNVIRISNKNFLDISKLVTQTIYGVKVTKNKDMSITLNGTSTNAFSIDIPLDNIILEKNTNYIFSKKTNMSGAFYSLSLRDTTGTATIVYALDSSQKTLEINSNTKQIIHYLRLYVPKDRSFTNHTFYPMLELGSTATTYEPHQGKELPLDLGSIELCKIGDYQDYFYKSGSKWYLHKEINTKIFDKTYSFKKHSSYNNAFFAYSNYLEDADVSNFANINIYSDKFQGTTKLETEADGLDYRINLASNGTNNPRIHRTDINSQTEFNNWLTNNSFKVIYKLKEPINTEITNTTLISQLEAIYNAPLYEQTNITQINNDLPMILDITACKDNINGIKAFIRK